MKKKFKIGFMILLCSLNIHANTLDKEDIENTREISQVNILTDEELWKKQESYVKSMKDLYSGLSSVNNVLNTCREHYYQNKTDEEKNNYLGATNDYSAALLVKSSILNQAITALDKKMISEKEMILENLRKYGDTVEGLLEKEKQRNNNLLLKYQATLNQIKIIYCKDLSILIN
jgi:hypothetical protein